MCRSTRIAVRRAAWRTVFWLVLPILFLLAFRLFWGYHAQRRLQAMLARLDALHVRYRPEQFPDASAIPANQNAVAALLAGPLGASGDVILITAPLEFQNPGERKAILKLLVTNRDLLDRIDAAQARPIIAWPRDMLATGAIPRLIGAATTAHLLHKAARIAHEQHDDALALKHIYRLMTLARVYERSPVLIFVLLSNVCREAALSGLDEMQATLSLQDPAAAAAAEQLLTTLLDDRATLAAWPNALEGELAMRHVTTFGHTPGFRVRALGDWLLQPLVQEALVRSETQWASMATTCREPDWPRYRAAQSRVPATPRPRTLLGALIDLGFLNAPSFADRYDRILKNVIHSRAAAMLLAARLYAARRGNLPASAADLAPDLLPNVPMDLYLDPMQSLRYRVDPAGPTVWSVFENGKDDHADPVTDFVLGAANPLLPPAPPKPPAATRPATSPATATRRTPTP
jgi:hypothetical protein